LRAIAIVSLGRFNGYENPKEVENGQLGDYVASGWHPIAAHQIDLTLKPGESRKLGLHPRLRRSRSGKEIHRPRLISNKTPAEELIARYNTVEKAEAALAKLHAHWDGLLSIYHAESGDEKLDRMANIWNQYQCMVTYLFSRSASYYESGIGRGMGFRDSCQDLLGFVHLIPEKRNNGSSILPRFRKKMVRPITNISHSPNGAIAILARVSTMIRFGSSPRHLPI
jgi:cellobiose phosphorylase